ncbi:MAG: SDR family NAD(P)-dependent oxidoreductase, partial [Janthinobacterium lividum]
MMIDLNDQVALVTGASGEIGKAIAISLHRLGCHVIISGSKEEKLRELADKLGNNYTIKICDLKDPTARSSLITSLDKKLDILVCNAGITQDNLAIKMTDEAFSEVIEVNLKAAFV